MNLHDWIDELCDELDIEVELDETLILDLAREAAHNVDRRAAPISAYLLGYAAGTHDADADALESMATDATELATRWDKSSEELDDDTDDGLGAEVDSEVELAEDDDEDEA